MTPTGLALQSSGVQVAVNNVISNIIQFVPRLIWSLIVLGVGVGVAVFVAGRAGDAVRDSDVLADGLASPVATSVKVLLYFFAATIALSELGLRVGILAVFLDGVAFGLGAGFALLVGIGIGWGSKDYVAEHLEEWIDDATEGDDGGED